MIRISINKSYANKRWLVHAELKSFPFRHKWRHVKTLVFEQTETAAIKRAYQIYTSHPSVIADDVEIKRVESL